jgi:hypothetical protein
LWNHFVLIQKTFPKQIFYIFFFVQPVVAEFVGTFFLCLAANLSALGPIVPASVLMVMIYAIGMSGVGCADQQSISDLVFV